MKKMDVVTNQAVITPLGNGTVQAPRFGDSGFVLVRLPLNDITRAQLNQEKCVTPKASQLSALFIFPKSELQENKNKRR